MTEPVSPEHGKRDGEHGPQERGLGARRSPADPRDFPLDRLLAPAAAGSFPPSWLEANTPPVQDQGSTPRCVAFSSAYDQNHIDRPESGRWWNFDEAKFFAQIGGTAAGAYMRDALKQRLNYGYPTVAGGDRGQHRISAYYRVPLDLSSIKAALTTIPNNGGVLVIGPWFHSWMHPTSSGRLPRPDYEIGGHAWWLRGWTDSKTALRGRNSWGTDWGIAGDFYLPYSYIGRLWEIWRTVDR